MQDEKSEGNVRYQLSISAEEARNGTAKILSRNGKRLQVTIPPGIGEGGTVKLSNALKITDGREGDILISVGIKEGPSQAEATPPRAEVVELSDANFEAEVLGSNLPVMVDFWAAWCGPCRMMAPIVEKAAMAYAGRFKFCKINVDENPGMSSQYQAMSIPTLLFFKNGEVVERSVGAIPAHELKAKLEALL